MWQGPGRLQPLLPHREGSGDPDRASIAADALSIDVVLASPLEPVSRDANSNGIPDECEEVFHRGDPDGDGRLDLTDAVVILAYLFLGIPAPGCLEAADGDNSGVIDLLDAVLLLYHAFLGGPPPAAPGPPPSPGGPGGPCGPDPDPPGSAKALGCKAYRGC